MFAIAVEEHLLWREVAKQFLYVVSCSFTSKELTRRDIKEGHTKTRLAKVDSRKEVVLLVVKHIVAHGHTWSYQFCYATLNKFFGEFGVFQLVADGHTFASTNQLGQIGIKSVMWKSSHLVALATCTVVTMGKRNTKNLRGSYSIFAICFIEVATSEQHDCIRMFRLKIKELFHHWG